MKHRTVWAAMLPAAALLSILSVSACTAAPETGSLIVVDGSLRALGSDCAGAGAHRSFHAGAELTIVDSAGARVASAELAPGTAIAADTRDYGAAKRVPSYCAFEFDASGLVESETYGYLIDGEHLGEFTHRLDDGEPAPIAHPALGDPTSVLKGTAE